MGPPRKYEVKTGVNRLVQDLAILLEDVASCDTTLLVGPQEKPVKCHSLIVQCRCRSYNGQTRFPDSTPEGFQILLTYIYTGKLNVTEQHLFELFALSAEFGLDDLISTCEEMLCDGLDPGNAFTVLQSALSAKQKGKKYMDRIIDRCIAYVGENAAEAFHTDHFLNISQQCLITLIDSDNLCLEEEQVWRCVLQWAQFQADVDSHVGCWTESERKQVAKYLTPVISHVRLLLIDSRVFAEEVEPTGCVPMELSLARYRFAALPHQFQEADPRLTPRNSPRLFQSSSIITNERIMLGRKLNEWFGSPKQSWRCIYRASLHGFAADAFHKHCDGFAPTYVVAQIQNTKWICGGFSDIPWSRSKTPRYTTSAKAFLFSFDGNGTPGTVSEPVRFKIVKKHFAICQDSNNGPIFGAGADLYISSMCNMNSDSYSNLPHSYEAESVGKGSHQTLTPSYNFSIADYEVFTPIATPAP